MKTKSLIKSTSIIMLIILIITFHGNIGVGIISWLFLYFATGGFSMLAAAVYIIHELLYVKTRYRFFITLAYLLLAVGFPYFAWHYIFYIPVTDAWFYPILFPFSGITKILLLILLGYFAMLLIMIRIWLIVTKKTQIQFVWNPKTISFGVLVILILSWGIKKYSYDAKTELILGIDNCIQNSRWDDALKISRN